jgi:hypothetical protein
MPPGSGRAALGAGPGLTMPPTTRNQDDAGDRWQEEQVDGGWSVARCCMARRARGHTRDTWARSSIFEQPSIAHQSINNTD